MAINLYSKKSLFLAGNLIIISAITIIVLIAEGWLHPMVANEPLRIALLVIFALGLYLFLSGGLSDALEAEERRLKDLVDETLHELNTPIATIEANLKMLRRTCTGEREKRRLERIGGACENLTRLYESIEYDIKKNINHIENRIFDISETIADVIGRFEDIRGEIEIKNELDPFMIKADRAGFERVAENLISNAIKYNRPGGYVRIYREKSQLIFEDSGRGIDTKNLFIVFERAFQEIPDSKGHGLGLAIVKNYCDRHKIKIGIDTKKGTGTRVLLDLSIPHSMVSST